MTIDTFVALAAGAALMLVGLVLLQILQRLPKKPAQGQQAQTDHDGMPGIDQIASALEPHLYRAIFAGERAAIWGLNELNEGIQGMDKKAVADSIYSLLPDLIIVGVIPIPIGKIKAFITKERFEEMVKDLYMSTDAFIKRNQEYLRHQVDALKVSATVAAVTAATDAAMATGNTASATVISDGQMTTAVVNPGS